MTDRLITIPAPNQHCTLERISVFGSADITNQDPLYHDVFKACALLAREGKIIIDGGGPGVMAAATTGAQSEGGKTIAVTFRPKDMPEFEGRYAGNEPDLEIVTTNYIERMFGLINEADAFIIFRGGTGTLSEWATAWLLSHLHYGNHKPIVLYGQFWHEVMRVINEHFFIGEKEHFIYKIVTTPEQLMTALGQFEQDLKGRCNLPPRSS